MKDWVYKSLEVGIVVLLLTVFWQDMRSRSVRVWVLALLVGIVIALRGLHAGTVSQIGAETGINALIIGIHLLAITLYLSVKYHTFTLPVGKFLGLGDVIFWIIPAIFFSPVPFIGFLCGSSLFALVTHGVLRVTMPRSYSPSIPLAGLQALWMTVTVAGKYIFYN